MPLTPGCPLESWPSCLTFGFSWKHCLLYLLPPTPFDKRRPFPEVSNVVRERVPKPVAALGLVRISFFGQSGWTFLTGLRACIILKPHRWNVGFYHETGWRDRGLFLESSVKIGNKNVMFASTISEISRQFICALCLEKSECKVPEWEKHPTVMQRWFGISFF